MGQIFNLFQLENSEEKIDIFRERCKITCKIINFLKNVGSLGYLFNQILILKIFEDLLLNDGAKRNRLPTKVNHNYIH